MGNTHSTAVSNMMFEMKQRARLYSSDGDESHEIQSEMFLISIFFFLFSSSDAAGIDCILERGVLLWCGVDYCFPLSVGTAAAAAPQWQPTNKALKGLTRGCCCQWKRAAEVINATSTRSRGEDDQES